MTGTDDDERSTSAKASAAWRAAHPERMKALRDAWRAAHRAKLSADTADWKREHPDEARAQNKAFYAAHRTAILAARKTAYWAKKRNTDGEPK
jgi:hypothetical protein